MATRTPTRLEDLEWMAQNGESRIGAARRLGVKPRTLDQFLHRARRSDVLRALARRDPVILLPHERTYTAKTRRVQ